LFISQHLQTLTFYPVAKALCDYLFSNQW